MNSDIVSIFRWGITLFVLGLFFLPISNALFSKFFDKGYIFSKTLGIIFITYFIFIFGVFRILPYTTLSLILILVPVGIYNVYLLKKGSLNFKRSEIIIFLFQEILFFASLIFWSNIKTFQPDINGLEKFMDYGFINSILRTEYFPPVDMWFPPFSINYYYFGHLVTANLIKLSGVQPFIAYNLMLSTIFAFTVTSAFSIVSTISKSIFNSVKTAVLSGILAGVLTSLGGNLHTVYSFFRPYSPPENPVPFWSLQFLPQTFPNSYWYPNATRFIPFTIHEFPSYSFVVSDLHGHVLDIPFVFLTLGLILKMFLDKKIGYRIVMIVGFMLAFMYMTNAWDGLIYLILLGLTILLLKSEVLKLKKYKSKIKWFRVGKYLSVINNKRLYLFQSFKLILAALIVYFVATFPFNLNFKPFVSGIGMICPPDFLTRIGSIGPLIFEADHCQRTPFWMLVILYGFFYFFVTVLAVKILKLKNTPPAFIYVLLLILLSTVLIALPEFIYAKDIYPAHYRANTMFKLGYQAFIMLSLSTSFAIVYMVRKGKKILWVPTTLVFLSLIMMYPYFAVQSYFGELKNKKSLDGIGYLKQTRPDDYEGIMWINENIKGQPVILEAQGDSYTDYGRISANTGLPTPLGWTVHEWLWRGDYSYPQSRLGDIVTLYEGHLSQTLQLIKKYNISYIYVGGLEREKYQNLNESKFETIGEVIFQKNNTRIYKL